MYGLQFSILYSVIGSACMFENSNILTMFIRFSTCLDWFYSLYWACWAWRMLLVSLDACQRVCEKVPHEKCAPLGDENTYTTTHDLLTSKQPPSKAIHCKKFPLTQTITSLKYTLCAHLHKLDFTHWKHTTLTNTLNLLIYTVTLFRSKHIKTHTNQP